MSDHICKHNSNTCNNGPTSEKTLTTANKKIKQLNSIAPPKDESFNFARRDCCPDFHI